MMLWELLHDEISLIFCLCVKKDICFQIQYLKNKWIHYILTCFKGDCRTKQNNARVCQLQNNQHICQFFLIQLTANINANHVMQTYNAMY